MDTEEFEEIGYEGEPLVVTKIKMIVSGTCQICKVTPLFNIQNDPASVKKYGRTLDSALVRHADKVDATDTKVFKTRCSFLPLNPDESTDEFMFVEIFEQLGRQKETRSLCFMAMFFGLGSSQTGVKHLKQTKNVKNLPTVIHNGSSKYWGVLEPALEKLFSCNFLTTELSQMAIKSITAAWLLESIRTGEGVNKIHFTFAHGLLSNSFGGTLDTVFVFTPFITKWKRYLRNPNLGEAIQGIWKDISKEITSKNKIEFSKAAILKVASSSYLLKSEGRFKLRLDETDMILAILGQITQALEQVRA